MIARIEIPLDGDARREISGRMSEAMGAFVEAVGDTDFSTWTAEQWDQFVSVAYDVCATTVFMKRILIVPPADVEFAPPYPVE
jgi:hypothetical protein